MLSDQDRDVRHEVRRKTQVTQILVLGAVFWVIGAAWDLGFACLAGVIGTWLHRRPNLRTAQPRVEGVAYISLAGWAALAGNQ
jgi:threonine/homoserine/homoserine lactone efflux protein